MDQCQYGSAGPSIRVRITASAFNGAAHHAGPHAGVAIQVRRYGYRRCQVWVLPSSEKPMKPRTSSLAPFSTGLIFTE